MTFEVQGTLREDGTLVLDEKPNLPPGRVKVTVVPAANDVVSILEEIHAAQRARGYVPPSAEEIDAYLAEMREEGEREELIERIQEECRQQRAARAAEGE